MIRTCKHHGETDYAPRKGGGWRCRKCTIEAVSRRRRKVKKDLVALHGGKCILCGYNKCMRALCFHHRDPTQKEFYLHSGKVIGWDKLIKEAEKCDLLCMNCHCEVHHNKQ